MIMVSSFQINERIVNERLRAALEGTACSSPTI
jgi:hypothetical protein